MTGPADACAARPARERLAAARAAERGGQLVEAEAEYREVLAEDPRSSAAALGLVRLLDGIGDRRSAEQVLRSFVATANTSASIFAAGRQLEAWEDSPLSGAPTVRVALTGSGTLGPIGTHLRVACAQAAIHPFVYVSAFDQWAQDIFSDRSPLYEARPDLIILLLAGPVLFPTTMTDPDADQDTLDVERAHGLARIKAVLDAASRNSAGASIVVHTFSVPDRSPFGITDLKQERGQRARVEALNEALVSLVRDRPNVLLLDQERVEARHGKARVRDERLWYIARIPFSESFLPVLAAEYVRVIRALKGLVRKCVILDLDETLWGGVIGEDGLEGIKLGGNDAPGNAYYDFQVALDGLRRRGVVLALCSRNNPEDVWPVIEGHPHMVLRRSHFVATRINWNDKASNIRAIARELNLGVDSLVFLDDNPAERALVRQHLPEVLTVDLPADPAYYVRTLLDLDVFESLGATDEDRQRSDMYVRAQARREFEQEPSTTADLTSHLLSLDIVVALGPATSFAIPRIAQLVNKTNQFNLTTRRYTEAQVRAMVEATGRYAVFSVTVADRFGDLGLTGAAIVEIGGDVWTIDSLLVSCRVLGRGVEDALLTYIAARATGAGARVLQGVFIPTARNAPARNFYSTRGFHRVERAPTDDDATVFERPLTPQSRLEYPHWLRITETPNES